MATAVFRNVLDLVPAARTQGVQAFSRFLGAPVLVGPPPSTDGASGWSYRTDARQAISDPASCLVIMASDVVLPLRKVPGRPFADTVLVGRAASNDLCLEHPSVSKLHARLRLGAAGEVTLSDAGSSNGTSHGDRRLGAEESVVLEDGDLVGFGELRFQFLRPERLHGLLLQVKD